MPLRKPRRQLFVCLLAVGLGGIAALVAKILILGINFFTNLFYFQQLSIADASPSQHTLGIYALLPPVIGGVLVGLMARFGTQAIRGHGIPEAMEKILIDDSRIPKRVAILKPLSAAIAIGSGGPFGAEGPIIATGGALGSILGQIITVAPIERRVLLACGAAAGMAAIFGTPFAAVLLAIELLLFEFRPLTFIPVALSSVTAGTLHYVFFSNTPFLSIPDFPTLGIKELGLYLGSGIVFGLIAVGVTRLVYFLEDSFEKIPIHWMWWPALGGLAVGVIGLIEPKSLGVGYVNIEVALTLNITAGAALSLAFWKLCSWAIALSSGTSGGTLAPLLTIGSLSGLVLGTLANRWLGLDINVSVLALIGMAAVFAGSSRALLASVVFALEATRQPLGMIPLLGACSISYLVSHGLMANTIMTEKIVRRGVRVPHEYFPENPPKISI